jgi:hypothetical protein
MLGALTFALLAAAVALASVVSADNAPAACRSLLVPAYAGPEGLTALPPAAANGAPPVVVVNPANGPGDAPSDAYTAAIASAKRRGARVLAYVPTTHGDRDASAVQADIDHYVQWYGVQGVFLDEVSSDAGMVPYYQALIAHARAAGAVFVVLNPGAVPDPGYAHLADVLVTFEGAYSDYRSGLEQQPAWVRSLPADSVAHLVYGATREQALSSIASSSSVGYLYFTEHGLPNPWAPISSYASEQAAVLAQGCGQSIAAPAPPGAASVPMSPGSLSAGTGVVARPPVLTLLRVRPNRFAVVVGRAKPRRRVTTSTQISWRLDRAARITLTIERALPGHGVGPACRATPRGRRSNCTRYEVVGTTVKAAHAGDNAVRFAGRLGRRLLARGTYRVRAMAVDRAGHRSAERSATLIVLDP